MTATPHDSIEQDRHLRAALRHAPDADTKPPAALSDAILREARKSVATSAPPRWRRWLGAVVAPRPAMPWAGGFAGLLVATLVGVLWWREPVPPVRDESPARPLRDAPASSAPQDRAASLGDTSTAPIEQPPTAGSSVEKEEASPPPAASETRRARQSAASGPAKAKPAPRAPAPPPSQQLGQVAGQSAAQPKAAQPDAAPQPSPGAAPAAPAPAEPLAKSAAPASRDANLAAGARADRAERAERSAMAREADSTRSASAMPELPSSGLDDAARAWLARLLAEAGSRWQRHDAVLPADGRVHRWPAATPGLVVVLTPQGAYWRDESADRSWFVPLSPAQQQRIGAP